MEIYTQYKRMKENKEVILNQKWWNKLRYMNFGSELEQKLSSQPSLKLAMRKMFKDQNDQCSYYDFFQFIQHKLDIKLENWEEDALEGCLDRLGMAFIEFNEFNEFCQDYGIDWGEKLLDNDLESKLEEKLRLSYKDYIVTKHDYFMDCPTMLRSEKAALATVRKIYKDLKTSKAKKYLDPDFGPKNKNDIKGHRFSLYTNGEVPFKGYKDPNEIEWVYGETLATGDNTAQFVDDGAASADCVQGEIGDCWLISAMSTLVTRDELLVGGRRGMEYDKDMIIDKDIAQILSMGVYPPIFHKFRVKGLYVIRIFKNFEWIYVIIDERIPVDIKTKKAVFGHCVNDHEMWVSLIEKAYAKMHGCYGNLVSGYIDEGIQELTGMQPEKILIRDEKTGAFPHKNVKKYYGGGTGGFWKFLYQRKQENCLMGCSIKGEGKEGPQIIDGVPSGLILNHAYGIQDVMELEDKYDKQVPLKLVLLRNPWGKSEWKGAWQTDSPEFKAHRDHIEEYVANKPIDEQFDLDADDGTFFMAYSDWKENFSTLFLNIDFPEDWSGVRFKSAWTPTNSGGLPNTYTPDVRERFAKNPQFYIKCVEDTQMVFSMTQPGGRLPVNKKYFKYPFAETLKYACVSIFKLDYGDRYLKSFDKDKLQFLSPIKRERENTGRITLKGGIGYVIIPSTEIAGVTGEVFLSIYLDKEMRDVECKRVFHPLDTNEARDAILPKFIPEESEKCSSRAPIWKKQLCKEMLPYMITDEDAGVDIESSD